MIETSVLIAIGGFAVSVGTFFVGRLTAAKNSGQENGVILTELGYIKSGVDDMKKKMEKSDEHYNALDKRVTALEGVVKIYHGGGSVE